MQASTLLYLIDGDPRLLISGRFATTPVYYINPVNLMHIFGIILLPSIYYLSLSSDSSSATPSFSSDRSWKTQHRAPWRIFIATITPPKGVRTKTTTKSTSSVPHDEGHELWDCEGEEIDPADIDAKCIDEDPAPAASLPSTTSSSSASSSSPSPSTPHSEDINKDTALLQAVQAAIDTHAAATSSYFIPFVTQYKITLAKGKRHLKKRAKATDRQLTEKLVAATMGVSNWY